MHKQSYDVYLTFCSLLTFRFTSKYMYKGHCYFNFMDTWSVSFRVLFYRFSLQLFDFLFLIKLLWAKPSSKPAISFPFDSKKVQMYRTPFPYNSSSREIIYCMLCWLCISDDLVIPKSIVWAWVGRLNLFCRQTEPITNLCLCQGLNYMEKSSQYRLAWALEYQ